MLRKVVICALAIAGLSLSALADQPPIPAAVAPLGAVAGANVPLVAAAKPSPTAHSGLAFRQATSLQATQTLTLPLNKSQVISVDQAIGTIAVGNADIADAVALNNHSFYILGKKAGTTNVAVYGEGGRQVLAVIDVAVGTDIEGIKGTLHDILPHDRISVHSVNDGVVLSGTLSSPAKLSEAIDVAKRFVPGGHVINDLRVTGSQQVMLQVKVAEMQRSVSKSLNFKPFVSATNGNLKSTGFSFSTLDPVKVSQFAVAAGQAISGNFTVELMLDSLEQRGAVKILAEPNLIAMSGDTANFLAGGEFPVPVAQANGANGQPTITVVFKPFGISLAFTPTVIDGDLINLAVAPEVSQIDQTNAVTVQGFTIPGISTRRAKTTVELRDGQSFAIAGLLSSNFKDDVRGVSGIMDIPVLGALLRSTEFQRDETELVIIVTPKLVQPAAANSLIAPTDSFLPPSEAELFLLGRTESSRSRTLPVSGNGGLTGKYGHIIR